MASQTPAPKSSKLPSRQSRPGNHETLLISLAVLDMVPKVGQISAPEIHQRLGNMGFDRNLRSVQRLLEVLTTQFPIERDDSSKPHGFKWRSGAKGISIPGLTVHESLLLNMAEKYLQNLLPASLKQAMQGFFAQARYNLGPGQDDRLERRWLDKVRVVSSSVALLPAEIAEGVLEEVSQALFHETWLELDYSNAKSQRKQHRVMPLGLAQQGSRLVLVVRFEGFENERSLAMSRIHKATDTRLPFPNVQGFDLSKYEDDGRFGYGQGQPIGLKFCIDKELGQFLTESRLSKDQTVRDLGHHLEITATVAQSEHLVWWLRGFGKKVVVLEPDELVKAVTG